MERGLLIIFTTCWYTPCVPAYIHMYVCLGALVYSSMPYGMHEDKMLILYYKRYIYGILPDKHVYAQLSLSLSLSLSSSLYELNYGT